MVVHKNRAPYATGACANHCSHFRVSFSCEAVGHLESPGPTGAFGFMLTYKPDSSVRDDGKHQTR